ncbi:MAG: AEC family transporter [Clostridia bacterium]|nr:AEC family transporter [Clostridia bacterium]
MKDLIFALNAVLPIILMIVIGYFLKRINLLTEDTAKKLNTLVFKVFLPIMLFLNVYKIQNFSEIDFTFVFYAIGITVLLFLIGIPVMHVLFKDNRQRSVMLQGIFRANYALVGIPLAESLFGAEGSIMASLLSAFIVPVFNILAVICLTIYSAGDKKPSFSGVIKGIAKNPLIQGIFCGLVALGLRAIFVKFNIDFRLSEVTPIYKTLQNLSSVATPLSLLVLGARFELSAIPHLKKHIIIGTVNRVVIVPIVGISLAILLNRFSGAQFASFVACFCTPIAVSSVPMSQEMGADADLMGQLVVWSTVFSAFSIFIASFVLKALGIF